MVSLDVEKLTTYIRSLTNFEFYTNIGEEYEHMGATVADAVLQANLRYKTHVKPRINRILTEYSSYQTTTSIISLLETISPVEFLSWKGKDRVDRFMNILGLFQSEQIETKANLKNWLGNNENLKKLRAIKGVGPKTVDYFKILVGISTSAIDRHLINFIRLADLNPVNYQDAQVIVNSTADHMGINQAHLDHSIWQYQYLRQLGCLFLRMNAACISEFHL